MAKRTLTIDDEVKTSKKTTTTPKTNTQPKTDTKTKEKEKTAYDIKKVENLVNSFNNTYAKVQEERSKPVDSYAKAYEDSLGSKATVSDKKTDQKVLDRAKDIKVNTWGEDIHNHSQDGLFVRAKENYDEMYRRQHNGQNANDKNREVKERIGEAYQSYSNDFADRKIDSLKQGNDSVAETLKQFDDNTNIQRALVRNNLASDYELAQRNIQSMDEETRNSFNNIINYAIQNDDAETFKKAVQWVASYDYGKEGGSWDIAGASRRLGDTLNTVAYSIPATVVKLGSMALDKINDTYRGSADMLYDMGLISEGSYNALQIPDYDIMADDKLGTKMQNEIAEATALAQNNLGVVGKFALDATGSTSQFLLETSLLGPQAALYFMSGQSAADKYYENIANGYDEDTAMLNALATGMVSYGIEKFGTMDRFVEMMAGKGGDYVMGNLLHNLKTNAFRAGISEGMEEVAESMMDDIIDASTLGTPIEYKPGELSMCFLLGATSGWALGAYAAVNYTIHTAEQAKAMRSEIETMEQGLKNGEFGPAGSEEYVRAENTIKLGNDALHNFHEQSVLSEAITKVEPEAEALSPKEAVKTAHDSMIPTAEKMMQASQQTLDAVNSLNDNITKVLETNGIYGINGEQWADMSVESRNNAKEIAERVSELREDDPELTVLFDPDLSPEENGKRFSDGTIVLNPNIENSIDLLEGTPETQSIRADQDLSSSTAGENSQSVEPQEFSQEDISRISQVAKNAVKNGEIVDIHQQVNEMTSNPSTYGLGVAPFGNSLEFAGIGPEAYFSNRAVKISERSDVDPNLFADVLSLMPSNTVLASVYNDESLKNVIVEDGNSIYNVLMSKGQSREYIVDRIDKVGSIKNFESFIDKAIEFGDTFYKNEKSDNFLMRTLASNESRIKAITSNTRIAPKSNSGNTVDTRVKHSPDYLSGRAQEAYSKGYVTLNDITDADLDRFNELVDDDAYQIGSVEELKDIIQQYDTKGEYHHVGENADSVGFYDLNQIADNYINSIISNSEQNSDQDTRYSRNPNLETQTTETEVNEPLDIDDSTIDSLLTGNNKDMARIDRQRQHLIDTAAEWIPNYELIHKNYPYVTESNLSNSLFEILAYGELSDQTRESLKRDFVFGPEYEGVDQDLKELMIDDALQDGSAPEQAEHIAEIVDGFVNEAVEFFATDEAYKANKSELNRIANKANMFAKAEGVRATAPYDVYADIAKEGLDRLTESEQRIAEQKANEILENSQIIEALLEGGRNYQTKTKTLEQVLDTVANKNRTIRQMLHDGIQLKRDLAYTRNADIRDQYAKEVQKILDLGIKTGSEEAKAVTWLIEGHTQETVERADGKLEWMPFTEEDLKSQFDYQMKNGKMAWENIQEAADIARNTFAELGNQINDGLSQIYLDDDITRLYEKEKIEAQIKVQKELVSRLENELRVQPTAELQAALNRAQTELNTWQARLNAKLDQAVDGDDVRRRKLLMRKNYVHHSAMKTNFGQRLWQAMTNNGYDVPTALAGISQYVQPKSTFDTILLEQSVQPGGTYNDDIMMNLKDYIEKASYKIAFDPVVASYRNFTNNIANLDTDNKLNHFQRYMIDYTNQLAGKSNELDRVFRDTSAGNAMERAWNVFKVLNAQAKTAAVVGNVRSAVVQFANIGNGMAVVKMNNGTNADIAKGINAWMQSYNEGALHNQSAFMRNRFGDIDIGESPFTLNNVANKMMEFGDEIVARQLWYIGYEMGTRQGVDDPMLFADDIVRRSIGGRYKGEYAPIMTSTFLNALAPFQLETNNAWQTMKQAVSDKNWQAILYMLLTNVAVGAVFKELFGDEVVLDPVADIVEGIKDGKDINQKVTKAVGYTVGDVVSNIPWSSIITTFAGLTDKYGKWEEIFGDNSPNRYGISSLGVSGIADFIKDPGVKSALDLVTDYIPGGNQMMKTGKAAYYYGKGAYTTKSGRVAFAVDDDPINFIKSMLFGIWASDAGQEYLDGGNTLSDKQTSVFDYLTNADVKGQDAYNVADEITSSDSKAEIIDTLNDADYLTDEQRLEIYDMYTDTKRNDRLNDFAEAYDLTFEQEYAIKTAQAIEKDENQSAAEKRLEIYEQQGIMDELIKYVEENDLKYGDVGLNKTVVQDYLDSYEEVMNGSKSDSEKGNNKKRRTGRKSSKKSVKNPVDEFRASLTKGQSDSLSSILSSEVWNKTQKQIEQNIEQIRKKYIKNGLYDLVKRYLKNHPEADPKQFGL